MKINSNVRIIGKSVTLVPYRKEHVSLYHAWMVRLRTLVAPSFPCTCIQTCLWHRSLHHGLSCAPTPDFPAARSEAARSNSLRASDLTGKSIQSLACCQLRHQVESLLYRRNMTCSSVGWKMLTVRLHTVPGTVSSQFTSGIAAAANVFAPECTFILLDPTLPDTEGTGHHGGGIVSLLAAMVHSQRPTAWQPELAYIITVSDC